MSLQPSAYRPRIIDEKLARALKAFGAVEVAGPKFCGKTWSSMAQGESIVHIDDDAVQPAIELDASLALEGARPHIIDEWQEVPKIWDTVRRYVDATGNEKGQFILTGSSTVDKRQVSHSGAGRIARLHMRPMSLAESGDSDQSVSLRGLFEGSFEQRAVKTDVRSLARLISPHSISPHCSKLVHAKPILIPTLPDGWRYPWQETPVKRSPTKRCSPTCPKANRRAS